MIDNQTASSKLLPGVDLQEIVHITVQNPTRSSQNISINTHSNKRVKLCGK